MINKIFTLITIILATNIMAEGQTNEIEKHLGHYFQISQKEGTESLLRNYLRTLPSNIKTVYAILFQPQMCPRCEMDINQLYKNIKSIDPDATTLLWPNYSNSESVKKYITEKNFLHDYVLTDTLNYYSKVFSLSVNNLNVTYTLKIDREKGRLIFGGEIVKVSPTIYMLISELKEPKPFHDYNTISDEKAYDKNKKKTNINFTKIQLEEPRNYPISEILGTPSFYNETLCLGDELGNTFYTYNVTSSKGTFIKPFQVTIEEEMSFTDTLLVPKAYFIKMKKDNMVFSMANKGIHINDSTVLLSYSLPNLTKDPYDSASIAYYNKATLFKWNTNNNHKEIISLSLMDFTKDITDQVFLKDHTLFFVKDSSEVIVPVKKGFPCFEMEIKDWKGKESDYNPLIPDFYANSPIFSAYSTITGNQTQYFGKLDPIYEYYKVGYKFVKPTYHSNSIFCVYSCGTSGMVHLSLCNDPNTIISSIQTFNVNKNYDRSKAGTHEYLNDIEKKVFNNNISDVKVSQEMISVIFTENGTTFFTQYNLKGNLVKKKELPIKLNSTGATSYFLCEQKGKTGVYALFKEKNKHYLAIIQV